MAIADETLVPLDLGVSLPSKLYASYHRERVATESVKKTLAFLRTVVFDPKSMPWFDEEFRFPEENWKVKLAQLKAATSRPDNP
jgi:hypothetical protein